MPFYGSMCIQYILKLFIPSFHCIFIGMDKKQNAKKVGLVLSSGGARGITQIGVIKELEANGFEITAIAGSSIGALIGGLYLTNSLDEYVEWVRKLKQFDVFQLMDFSLSGKGFLKAKKVFSHLEKWLSGYKIEDLPIPFSVVATDIIKKEEVVFTKGFLIDAIRASVSIPNIIQPHKVDGRFLYDGGVVNPIPLNRLQNGGDELIVAVDLNAYDPTFSPEHMWGENVQKTSKKIEAAFYEEWLRKWFPKDSPVRTKTADPGFFSTTTGIIDVMQLSLSKAAIELHPPDILVHIPQNLCSTFEFHKSDDLIAFGRKKMAEALSQMVSK